VAFCFCGVVVLLFVRELGERVLPPRVWRMLLRLCADLWRSGPELLRSCAVVLCSGSDVCGSGSCGPDLLRSGPGCS